MRVFKAIHDLCCDYSILTPFGPFLSLSLIFCKEQFCFQGGHYDCYNSAHQTPPPITFTFILSNYRSRLLFQEESELSSKRWASAPRRPDSPCVLGAPTSREVSQSRFYPESSSDVPETSKLDAFVFSKIHWLMQENVQFIHLRCFLINIFIFLSIYFLVLFLKLIGFFPKIFGNQISHFSIKYILYLSKDLVQYKFLKIT